ncbi:hypothetical protein HBB16_21710, partial [Pseudonocardia sp. MCCB 268]|nr:hypothetical protein [Pseudonocardia cytotoxica]
YVLLRLNRRLQTESTAPRLPGSRHDRRGIDSRRHADYRAGHLRKRGATRSRRICREPRRSPHLGINSGVTDAKTALGVALTMLLDPRSLHVRDPAARRPCRPAGHGGHRDAARGVP